MQPLDPIGEGNRKNLILAFILAAVVMIGYEVYVYYTTPEEMRNLSTEQRQEILNADIEIEQEGTRPGAPALPKSATILAAPEIQAREIESIAVKSDVFSGRVAMDGGRIDELALPQYKVELGEEESINLFAPNGKRAHYFDAGWLGHDGTVTPDGNTPWQASSSGDLTPGNPLQLVWQNSTGQTFRRTYSIEEGDYAVRVTDEIINAGQRDIRLSHFSQVHKAGGANEGEKSTFVNYMGPLGYVDGKLHENKYDKLKKRPETAAGDTGWWGISSRYFLAAVIPEQDVPHTFQHKYSRVGGQAFYSAIVQSPEILVRKNETVSQTYRVYAGPKMMSALEKEGAELTRAVDYGWFAIIAKPLFKALMWVNSFVGNLGFAIIIVTIALKLALFPLANKSYKAMQKMKDLQPRMADLKERYKDDREKFTMETMKMYQTEKINPASGCWPVLMQIPIFFAMYKMLLVSFEFRHAPFIGWITDMSSKDPYFVLPILMGISMYIQFKLQPTPPDDMQKNIMRLMPIFMTVMFLMFPSGLVLYWLTNNVFSVGQQWYIMKAYGEPAK